jgi:hypothetical protein
MRSTIQGVQGSHMACGTPSAIPGHSRRHHKRRTADQCRRPTLHRDTNPDAHQSWQFGWSVAKHDHGGPRYQYLGAGYFDVREKADDRSSSRSAAASKRRSCAARLSKAMYIAHVVAPSACKSKPRKTPSIDSVLDHSEMHCMALIATFGRLVIVSSSPNRA